MPVKRRVGMNVACMRWHEAQCEGRISSLPHDGKRRLVAAGRAAGWVVANHSQKEISSDTGLQRHEMSVEKRDRGGKCHSMPTEPWQIEPAHSLSRSTGKLRRVIASRLWVSTCAVGRMGSCARAGPKPIAIKAHPMHAPDARYFSGWLGAWLQDQSLSSKPPSVLSLKSSVDAKSRSLWSSDRSLLSS